MTIQSSKKIKLSKKFLASATAETGTIQMVRDTECRGLFFRISARGKSGELAKAFVLRYINKDGSSKSHTIGRYPDLTLDQARTLAEKLRADIAAGIDPQADRKEEREADTLDEFFEWFQTKYSPAKNKQRTIETDQGRYDAHIRKPLGKKKLASITRQDIEKITVPLNDNGQGTLANRVRALLSTLCNLAESRGQRAPNSNPCRYVVKYREAKRQRYLEGEELQKLLMSFDYGIEHGDSRERIACYAYKLLLFTGCRSREVFNLKWEDYDEPRGKVFLRDTKSDRDGRNVWLNQAAVDVISELKKERENILEIAKTGKPRDRERAKKRGVEFMIAGYKPNQPITDSKKTFAKILKRAGIEDFRPHDLRHSFASIAAGLGQSLPMIGKMLGHRSPMTTARYAHLVDELEKTAVNQVGDSIAAAIEKKSAKVESV